MKVLFIGGTGTISMAITQELLKEGHEVYLINRGNRNKTKGLEKAHFIISDINNEDYIKKEIESLYFDVVCDFIGFELKDVERDYRLFNGKTKQFMYISSASCYKKPVTDYIISEKTTLSNPFWIYSQNKIKCEKYLMDLFQNEGFPVTIIRPSHTYDKRSVPLGVHGRKGSYQVVKRISEGKPVIIHGDGTSLWTVTHNSDFAKGFIGLMNNIHAIGESVQITSDESVTWNDIYNVIADTLNVKLNPVYVPSLTLAKISEYDLMGSLIGDKANSVVFDCSKLKRLVPYFTATKRMDQGIKETVLYVMSHKECQKEDLEFDLWCDKVAEAVKKFENTFK